MGIGVVVFIIIAVIAVIWLIVEFKRFRHKFWAVLLIALIILTYIGFCSSIKGKGIDFKTMDGLETAGALYWAWLSNVFGNMKTITVNAVHMDWKGINETTSNDK